MAADHACVISIHDRRIGILFEVGRNERLFRETQNVLQLSVGCILQSLVYFFLGSFFLNVYHNINQGDIRSWHADADTVEFSFQFRQHERHSFGRARRSRNHRERGGACASQVFVREV